MPTRPPDQQPEQDRHPRWTVQSVFDPDGGGHDFAYTVGLTDLDLPELHLWARPTEGDDPGEDWMLSVRDRTILLNELAWMLVDGELAVGGEVVREYDGGEARVVLRVGPPGDREDLEAYGTARDATVLPLAWSLVRVPEGEPVELVGDALRDARAHRTRLLTGIDPTRTAPGWALTEPPTYSSDQRFGPLTPVVVARAAQLWQADLTDLNVLLRALLAVDAVSSVTFPVTMATAVARRVGRSEVLRGLRREAEDLVERMTQGPVRRLLWGDVLASLGGERGDPESWTRFERGCRGLLLDGATAVLCAEAVADVIDRQWLLHARGPLEHAISSTIEVPGPEWCAPDAVLAVVRTVLDRLDATDLVDIAHRHDRRMRAVLGFDAYANAFTRIHAIALTGPAGCPWTGVLDGRVRVGANASRERCWQLREWASGVTAVLCHRARVSDDDVTTFAAPYRDLLPDLEDVLNEVVVEVEEQESA